ncbi:MAG: ATP-binding protein [Pseudomonadota bacterium]
MTISSDRSLSRVLGRSAFRAATPLAMYLATLCRGVMPSRRLSHVACAFGIGMAAAPAHALFGLSARSFAGAIVPGLIMFLLGGGLAYWLMRRRLQRIERVRDSLAARLESRRKTPTAAPALASASSASLAEYALRALDTPHVVFDQNGLPVFSKFDGASDVLRASGSMTDDLAEPYHPDVEAGLKALRNAQDKADGEPGDVIEVTYRVAVDGAASSRQARLVPLFDGDDLHGFLLTERASPATAPAWAESTVPDASDRTAPAPVSADVRGLHNILSTLPFMIYWKANDGRFLGCNEAFASSVGVRRANDEAGTTASAGGIGKRWAVRQLRPDLEVIESGEARLRVTENYVSESGQEFKLLVSKIPLVAKSGKVLGMVGVVDHQAPPAESPRDSVASNYQLESVGHLAAGIAHEIHTPLEFVGEQARLLRSRFTDIADLLERGNALATQASKADDGELTATRYLNAAAKANLKDVISDLPATLEKTVAHVDHVRGIVASMKAFTHPGDDEMSMADINEALENTVVVCTNEWKYVADVSLELDEDLPLVPCYLAELNQVFLNLLVNAAHAVAESNYAGGGLGRIDIATRQTAGFVEIVIADDGSGMPERVRERVFEPFFTTKEVGKGTGQGLSIAHGIVVHRHGGQIEVESEPGEGSVFRVRLPISQVQQGGNPEEAVA